MKSFAWNWWNKDLCDFRCISQNVLVPDLPREWEESDPLRASSILSWFLLAMTEPFAKTSPRRQKWVLLELWLWFLMGSNKSKIYFTILAESRALSWIIWKTLMVRDSKEVRFLLDFLEAYEGCLTTLLPVTSSPTQSHGEAFSLPLKSLHQLLEFYQSNSTTLVYEGGCGRNWTSKVILEGVVLFDLFV